MEVAEDIFPSRFKALKDQAGVTYPFLAARLGITARTVQMYAQGVRKPDYWGLRALADFFDVSLDYLVGRSDDPTRH